MLIEFILNGDKVSVDVAPEKIFVDVIRDDLGLTGTKVGCGRGECGACTIIMDGKPVNSCLMFAAQADGHVFTTIEGLSKDGELDPIQKAFIEEGAAQCGYCIPGMIMSSKALLDKIPDPSDDEINEAISGNLCRCTGYTKIKESIKKAAVAINKRG